MSSKQTKPGSDSGHAPQQVWFFLVEAMDDPTFKQGCGTLDELKKTRMTLQRCLELSGVSGKKASDFSFWIHSQSMKAAVQMLTDESIIGTWNLYCQKDPIVLVIIRKATDPSPNTSRTPSHANSLSARQQHSAKRGLLVPELFIQPKVRHASGYSDMETFEEITDESTMVSIVQNGKTYTFTRDYLQGWIESELANLKLPGDVVVQSIGPGGQADNIRLTPEVWQKYLIRGPWKDSFAGV